MKVSYCDQHQSYRIIIPPKFTGTGRRQLRFFDDKKAAEAEIRQILGRGKSAAPKVTEAQLATITVADKFGLSEQQQMEAFLHYKKTVLATKKPGATIQHAAVKFLEQIQADQKNRRTLYKYRSTLRRLVAKVGAELPMVELSLEQLDAYLDSFGPGGTRRAQYANIRCFLSWALRKGFISVDPMAMERPKDPWGRKKTPLGIDDFRRILSTIAGNDRYKRLLPYYVLGGLAGMRRCEIISSEPTDPVISWKNIDWKQNLIAVPHDVAKETRKDDRRRWIPLEPAAAEWLRLVKRDSGPCVEISQSTLQRLNHELLGALKIRVPDNGLRNAYGTYAATFRSKGDVARAMGDLESTIDQYYIEPREPGSGKPWFEIRPGPTGVVIPFLAVA